MRRTSRQLTYANVMSTIAVFAALGGGAYAAASSIPGADGVIHTCYQVKKGAVRVVPAGKKCAKGERALAFNQLGAQGLAGTPGGAGAAGAKGEPGPQGPGATSLSTTLAQGAGKTTLATLNNGLILTGTCNATSVEVEVASTAPGKPLQLSGTNKFNATLYPADYEGTGGFVSIAEDTTDIDVIARSNSASKFEHIDLHGSHGSPCTFGGMIIPSS